MAGGDYGRVRHTFWTDPEIKRGLGAEAKLLLLYYFTNSHTNLCGLYYLPLDYAALETGLPLEKVREWTLNDLRRFVSYDERTEEVLVHRLTRHQVADTLSEKDKRLGRLLKDLDAAHSITLIRQFHELYAGWPIGQPPPAPKEAPSKPLRSPFEAIAVAVTEHDTDRPVAEPEPAATAGEVDRYRARVDLEAYADEHGYGARDRLIAIGEDITAWRTPTGEVVPQDERLRLLKLADAHAAEPGSKAHDRRSALRYVIAQQFDPFTIQAAAERAPRPGPQQAVTAPKPTVSADEKRARKDQELAAYAGWRERTQAKLDAEGESVRKSLEQEAKDAIGDIGLKMIQPAARERTIEAKMLELYGARIGTPAPAVAA
jgi:hypothetical protein